MKSDAAAILRTLRAAPHHISFADLAGQLHLTPQILAREIVSLKAAGYDIEEHPHFGYRFLSAPDRLIADDLSGMLDQVALARNLLVFEKTGSTNDLAAAMGRNGEPHGLVIFAEEQTAGRGRLGRRWESGPHQGLWFSILLRPRFSPTFWTRLTTWAAVAIAGAIEQETACNTAIKWPNDIYIHGKKAVGILIEGHFDKSQDGFAVLGIGVNVNHDHFPPEIEGTATSLKMAAGHSFDRQKIAAAILRELDALYPLLDEGLASIVARANERSFLNGKWIQAVAGELITQGRASRLDEHGGLVLALADGRETTISSGVVSLIIGEFV